MIIIVQSDTNDWYTTPVICNSCGNISVRSERQYTVQLDIKVDKNQVKLYTLHYLTSYFRVKV